MIMLATVINVRLTLMMKNVVLATQKLKYSLIMIKIHSCTKKFN